MALPTFQALRCWRPARLGTGRPQPRHRRQRHPVAAGQRVRSGNTVKLASTADRPRQRRACGGRNVAGGPEGREIAASQRLRHGLGHTPTLAGAKEPQGEQALSSNAEASARGAHPMWGRGTRRAEAGVKVPVGSDACRGRGPLCATRRAPAPRLTHCGGTRGSAGRAKATLCTPFGEGSRRTEIDSPTCGGRPWEIVDVPRPSARGRCRCPIRRPRCQPRTRPP